MPFSKDIFLKSVLKAVPIHCVVTGDEIACCIRQEYVNTFNHPLEVVYTFPTPHNAAVTGLTVTVGSRRIETEIMEKEAANNDYAKQIVNGNSAFILESERPNINRLTLGRVEPGERIVAETQLCMTAETIDDAVRICVPTAIAPRYLPCTMIDTPQHLDAAQRVAPPAGETGYMVEFDMQIDPLGSIAVDPSPSHHIISRQEDDGTWHIGLANGCCDAGRDIIVLYRYTDRRAQNTGVTDGAFLLAQFCPDIAAYQNTPCAYSFVLDCSGSMADQIDEAKQAIRDAFQYINDGDAFALICFNTGLLGASCQTMRYADAHATESALRFLDSVKAGGGTEMMTPLRMALMPQTLCTQHCVLLITDGQVGNDREIIAMAQQQRHSATRIFTVGIGFAANSYLVSELAAVSRGAAEHVYPGEDIARKIERQMIRCAGPRIADAQLAWADGSPCCDAEPGTLPEIYDGESLRVTFRTDSAERWPLLLSGTANGTPWTCALEKDDIHTSHDADIGRMWARARLARLARDYDACGNAYVKDELKNRAISLSVEYGVLCRWTTYYSAMLRKAGAGQMPATHHVPTAACSRAVTKTAHDEAFDLSTLFAGPTTFTKEILEPVDEGAIWEQQQRQQQLMHTWRHIIDSGGFDADKKGADKLVDTLFALWAYSDNMVAAAGCPNLSAVIRMLLGHRPAACTFDTVYYNILLMMIDYYLGMCASAEPDDFVQDFLVHLCSSAKPPVPPWVERLMIEFALMISRHSDKRHVFGGIAQHVAFERNHQLEQVSEEKIFQAALFAGISCRKNIVGYVERK